MRLDREHMAREALEQLIASGEGLRTEFKETTGSRSGGGQRLFPKRSGDTPLATLLRNAHFVRGICFHSRRMLWRPRSRTGNLDQIWIRSRSKTIQMSEPRLSELCSRLLEIVRLNPLVSRRTLSDELGVSERKVRESIDLMRKNGIILRQGAEHGGIWRISRVVEDRSEQKHTHEIASGTAQKKETTQKVSTHKTSLKTTQKSVATQKTQTWQGSGKKSRQKIVDLISSDPYMTTKQLVEKMGISRDGVNYHVRELKKTGVLRRVGGRKFGHWEVCDAESFVAARSRRPSTLESSGASLA